MVGLVGGFGLVDDNLFFTDIEFVDHESQLRNDIGIVVVGFLKVRETFCSFCDCGFEVDSRNLRLLCNWFCEKFCVLFYTIGGQFPQIGHNVGTIGTVI